MVTPSPQQIGPYVIEGELGRELIARKDRTAPGELGLSLLSGEPTPKRIKEAIPLLEKASRRNGRAAWKLSLAYEGGRYGLEQNPEKAYEYCRRAAAAGHQGARRSLGRLRKKFGLKPKPRK